MLRWKDTYLPSQQPLRSMHLSPCSAALDAVELAIKLSPYTKRSTDRGAIHLKSVSESSLKASQRHEHGNRRTVLPKPHPRAASSHTPTRPRSRGSSLTPPRFNTLSSVVSPHTAIDVTTVKRAGSPPPLKPLQVEVQQVPRRTERPATTTSRHSLLRHNLSTCTSVHVLGSRASGKAELLASLQRETAESQHAKYSRRTAGLGFVELSLNSRAVRVFKVPNYDAAADGLRLSPSHGLVLVYDPTSRRSFNTVKELFAKLEDAIADGTPAVFVENKVDLERRRVISIEQGEELAQKCNMKLYRTSAVEGYNVTQVFNDVVTMVARRVAENVADLREQAAALLFQRDSAVEPESVNTGGRPLGRPATAPSCTGRSRSMRARVRPTVLKSIWQWWQESLPLFQSPP